MNNVFKSNINQKQYLNLSSLAKAIIDNDMLMFIGKNEVSGFINLILEKYILYADASISLRLSEKEFEIKEMVQNDASLSSMDKYAQDRLLKALISEYKESLTNRYYEKDGNIVYFRLNDVNYNYIYGSDPLCPEANYYAKGGDYIKSIIEEYARKPFFEREEIVFSSTIKKLMSAIHSKKILVIKTQGLIFDVKPYAIRFDEQHRYRYLIGISRPHKQVNAPETISSFRISRINSISTRERPSGKVTHSEALEIEKRINKNGVMYLLSNVEKIRFRLTESGLQKYNTIFNQRPIINPSEVDGIYICKATTRQFTNYFFDFGKEIEVLSPLTLRNDFIMKYNDALNNYE